MMGELVQSAKHICARITIFLAAVFLTLLSGGNVAYAQSLDVYTDFASYDSAIPATMLTRVEDFSSVTTNTAMSTTGDSWNGFMVASNGSGAPFGPSGYCPQLNDPFGSTPVACLDYNPNAPALPGIVGSFGPGPTGQSVVFSSIDEIYGFAFDFVDWNDNSLRSEFTVTLSNGSTITPPVSANPPNSPPQFFGFVVDAVGVANGVFIERIDWTGVAPNGSELVGFWNVRTAVIPVPMMSVNKSIASLTTDADSTSDITFGDTLTYTVTMTNTGSAGQTNIVVSDSQLTPNSTTCGVVLAGDTCVLTGTHLVTLAEANAGTVINTAQVVSDNIPGPTASNTVTTPVEQDPSLDIVKSAATLNTDADGNGEISAGDTVGFTVTVTNDGNISLTNVVVSDGLLTPNSNTCATVAPGATCVLTGTYIVTPADATAGSFDNTASVTTNEVAGPTNSNTVTTPIPAAAIGISKVLAGNADEDGNGEVSEGDTLTFTTTATNTGAATLTNVEVSDLLITPNNNICATVSSGNTCVLTGTYVVTATDVTNGSYDNTARADSDQTNSVNDTLSTPIPAPGLDVAKALSANADEDGNGEVSEGDTLTFTVTATNSGSATLTNVVVTDNLITPNSNSCASVASGNSCVLTGTYVVTASDVAAGSFDNTGSANSDQTGSVDDTLNTPVEVTTLSLDKPAPANADEDGSGDVSVGDTLTYTVTATNTGTVAQDNVDVSDPMITPNTTTCATVAAGNTCVLTGTYTVTQADVDNGTIDNTAETESDQVTTPVPDSHSEPVNQTEDLSLVKPSPANADEDSSGDVSLGDTLTYTITATNSGTTTLQNVVVSDPLISPNSNTCAVVAPNATCVLTGTYTVTQTDVDNGSIANTAEVVSDEISTPVQDSNNEPVGQNDELSIDKPAPANADEDGSGDVSLGDTLTYTITATNSGTTTLNNVVVSDPMIAPNSNSCAVVAPTATCVLTGTYTVTQTDVDQWLYYEHGRDCFRRNHHTGNRRQHNQYRTKR